MKISAKQASRIDQRGKPKVTKAQDRAIMRYLTMAGDIRTDEQCEQLLREMSRIFR